MKRGDVYLVQLSRSASLSAQDQDQDRTGQLIPAVVLSRDALNQFSPTVVVAPIVDASAVHRLYPSDVRVPAPEGGLTADSVILAAQVRSVPRARLSRQLGVLGRGVMAQTNRALRITFALDEET